MLALFGEQLVVRTDRYTFYRFPVDNTKKGRLAVTVAPGDSHTGNGKGGEWKFSISVSASLPVVIHIPLKHCYCFCRCDCLLSLLLSLLFSDVINVLRHHTVPHRSHRT